MNQQESPEKTDDAPEDFAQQAEQAQIGFLAEFLQFLIYNKRWWLTPIIVVMLLVGALLWLGTTGAAPFVYTMW